MKYLCPFLLILALAGCQSKSAANNSSQPGAPKARVYDLEAVEKDLKDGGVVMNGSHEDVDNFFKTHPEYHVCRKLDTSVIAVMRNPKTDDPRVMDQFIVLAFRDGKVANLEVGPAMFSVGNLESYCR